MGNTNPELNTRWSDGQGGTYRVVGIYEITDHTWVHYIKDEEESATEYSCYVESFLARFIKIPK